MKQQRQHVFHFKVAIEWPDSSRSGRIVFLVDGLGRDLKEARADARRQAYTVVKALVVTLEVFE